MSGQEKFESIRVDLPVSELRAKQTLERRGDLLVVDDLDLGNQPIQPEPHCGIADVVDLGHLLERTGGQYEAFDERPILLA